VAAEGRTVPDVIGPDLAVLFVGINPGLYSGAVGHHFARPGNRFWKALELAGFTDRVLSPFEEHELLRHRLGVTNLVDRATRSADDLSPDELRKGASRLERKVRRYEPRFVAVLGVSAHRTAFGRSKAVVGRQDEDLAGAKVWVLPNPSGRSAHYPRVEDLVPAFAELRTASQAPGSRRR
jgi:TDG/mug DNA glycosylase family protein